MAFEGSCHTAVLPGAAMPGSQARCQQLLPLPRSNAVSDQHCLTECTLLAHKGHTLEGKHLEPTSTTVINFHKVKYRIVSVYPRLDVQYRWPTHLAVLSPSLESPAEAAEHDTLSGLSQLLLQGALACSVVDPPAAQQTSIVL